MQQHPEALFAGRIDAANETDTFDLAPVSLWLEDYSALKALFDEWRADGVVSLREFLHQDASRIIACSERLRVIKVNNKTLALFEADDQAHLIDNLDRVFRGDMHDTLVDELVQLWNGQTEIFNHAVNYTLSGRRLDIQLTARILPGHERDWKRVLVSIEDVSEREGARRRLAISESYSRGLFEHSPISLWVEDFSGIKHLLDEVRAQGIFDFRIFTDVHPEFVDRCISEIRVLDVNRHTLDLFGAPDKTTLLHRLSDIFRDEMHECFREQLIDLWQGKIFQQREVVNYSLSGDQLHLHLQFSVLPGYERDWSLVQVALTDITARKKAEAYLEYLGKHDVLTKLYNRSFYVDELNRLERKGPYPVTIIIIDINGLKVANDQLGHSAGDSLLRRAGEVLGKVVEKPCHAARIGGDEFAVLMPNSDEQAGALLLEQIQELVDINNQFYSSMELSLSMSAATGRKGEQLESVAKRADLMMYEAKRNYYHIVESERRPSQQA